VRTEDWAVAAIVKVPVLAVVRLGMEGEEIAGDNPTPLEVLLTERVVACWMLVQLFDVLMAGQQALPRFHPDPCQGEEAAGQHTRDPVQHPDQPQIAPTSQVVTA
jgi:hypothetical protein